MTPEELKNYLKENLKISIALNEAFWNDSIKVSLYLENDVISTSEILIDELNELTKK